MLRGICIHCFREAAVQGEIGLLVAGKIQSANHYRAGNRLFEDAGAHRKTLPDGFARHSDVYRGDSHERSLLVAKLACWTVTIARVMIWTTAAGADASGEWSTSCAKTRASAHDVDHS